MELKAGSSSVLPTSPAPLKAILCPLRGRSLPDRLKVGGEVAPFPLRHPFRFHSRRFANVSALRSLPPPHPTPPVSHLRPRPWERAETQGPSRRGRREGWAPAAAVQDWGPGRGAGARSLPTAPGARHPTFISGHSRTQTPTSPWVHHDATCAQAPPPLGSGLRHSPGFQGARRSGNCSSPRTLPAGGRRGPPKAQKSRVWMRYRTFPFISTESFSSVIGTLLGGAVLAGLTHQGCGHLWPCPTPRPWGSLS